MEKQMMSDSPTGVALGGDSPRDTCFQTSQGGGDVAFAALPADVLLNIFKHLDVHTLSAALEVSREWSVYASSRSLWNALGAVQWRALKTDINLPQMLRRLAAYDTPGTWRSATHRMWSFSLHKANRYYCNMTGHLLDIGGQSSGDVALPKNIVVDRRFPTSSLQEFTLPTAAIFYFEPEHEADEERYWKFADYLDSRDRAGLAIHEAQRIVFIPHCKYARESIGYSGHRLVGIVQSSFPEVAVIP